MKIRNKMAGTLHNWDKATKNNVRYYSYSSAPSKVVNRDRSVGLYWPQILYNFLLCYSAFIRGMMSSCNFCKLVLLFFLCIVYALFMSSQRHQERLRNYTKTQHPFNCVHYFLHWKSTDTYPATWVMNPSWLIGKTLPFTSVHQHGSDTQ